MTTKLTTLTVLFLVAGVLLAQAPSGDHRATKHVCQLISTNPPDFHPFQFVPKEVDFQGLNRFPKVGRSAWLAGAAGEHRRGAASSTPEGV